MPRTIKLADYAERYDHVHFTRNDGVLELRLHADGGPLLWGASVHEEIGNCFADVARDPENRVVILTGTGDRFCEHMDDSFIGPMTAERWQTLYFDGRRMIDELLGIEVPVIGAVNGPARVHSELVVLSDITLAADTAVFQDAPHFRMNTVPGDGMQGIWMALLGVNRGRYFLFTGQRIPADEALRLGVVNEVLPPDALMDRARELARQLCRQSDTTLRYSRIALTTHLRRTMADHVQLGLALEGLNAFGTWPAQ